MRNRLRPEPEPEPEPTLYYSLTGVPQELRDDPLAPSDNVTPVPNADSPAQVSTGVEGELSPDLALDLLLHEIAELACFSTGASGIAIALTRAGELVCRAATGNAPDLDVRLNPHSGLSGLCLQTKTVQRCDDTEVDPRVDVAACRKLKVRSILVMPVLNDGNLAGLLEAFSSSPNHFGDHDTEELKKFTKQIADLARETFGHSPASKLAGGADLVDRDSDGTVRNDSRKILRLKHFRLGRWALPLSAAAITMALFLGWFAGRTQNRRTGSPNTDKPGVMGTRAPQSTPVVIASNEPVPSRQVHSADQSVPVSNNSANEKASGDLVVYQNGKEIFREPPRLQPLPSGNKNKRLGPVVRGIPAPGVIRASKTELIPPWDAKSYVISRVDPIYPESAKKQRIEGRVLLKVLVGKDGGVQQVQILNGNPSLATAASDALIHWQFKPLLRRGQPVEFKTQVTVNFKLPQ